MEKTYLITGASSDVAVELIQTLAKNGGKFVLQGNNDMEKIISVCKEHNIDADFYSVNLSDTQQTDEFVNNLDKYNITHYVHFPALRVVNTKFKNFDEERFLLDINVQIMSAVKISKKILPKMAKNKYGRVLFMATSYVLANPPKNTAAYLMVKNSIVGLMKSLAVDYAPSNVTVNCVSPSMIETKFLQDTSHIIVEAAAAAHPMKRNATVKDVAPAMVFLLSDEAGYITGVNLPITGGSVIE